MKLENRKRQVEKMIFSSLENLYKAQDTLQLDEFAITTIEALMLLEREEYLKSSNGINDIGNGTYPKTFRSLRSNSIQINIPRTRNGEFKPISLEILKKSKEDVQNLSLLLYRKGLSTRDIESVMNEYFGESMSTATISNLAQSFHEIREKWQNTKLDAYYKVIFCDAIYVSIKRGGRYSKEAVYVAYGVKDDNTRELILLECNPTESSTVWKSFMEQLKDRGVEDVDLFVADGLVGFGDAVRTVFPYTDIQRCVVHLQRNLLSKVRPKDKPEFGDDLKKVFNNFDKSDSKELTLNKIQYFVSKWESSYGHVKNLKNEEFISDYLTYIDYSTSVRRMIYTTNSIENLNRQIRKVTKTKVTLESESRALDLIFMIIKDFEATNWQKYPVSAYQEWPRRKTQTY
jgi:putative transposase